MKTLLVAKRNHSALLSRTILVTFGACLFGLTVSSEAASVMAEAESGTLGSEFASGTDGATQYISVSTDLINAEYPGSANRVATYNVTFPAAGTYDLYVRVRVGPLTGNDDSLFYGYGFGTKSVTAGSDWIRVNNLYDTAGYTNGSDIVRGAGMVGSGVWKWLDLSAYSDSGSEAPISFTVSEGNLTQVFQIGGRENGLEIDKLVFGSSGNIFTVAQLDAGAPGTPAPQRDVVNGNLVQFSQNGIWCWFQDERAVVDTNANKLVVGYIQNQGGLGGSGADGDVSATIWDVASGTGTRSLLKNALLSYGGGDDHNAPALLVLPNGKYLEVCAGHNNDKNTFYRIYDPATGLWSAEQIFNWNTQPGGADFENSYSNPYYLANEGRVYNLSRGNGAGSPNIMVSTDLGETWTYGGELTTNNIPGYVQGYFRYWGNGVDRIDFICTEAHPGDYNTSIYHGYISNGMSFDSFGAVRDANIFDKVNIPRPSDFTPVFAAGTVLPPGQTNYRCWNIDVCRYPDGTIEAIMSTRINNNDQGSSGNPNHAFFFCRFDGVQWKSTYLCQAGLRLYSSQADYTGLGALNPNDPNTIYISTKFDPRAVQPGVFDSNQEVSTVHEIWKGVTTNHGDSFTWTPITQNSVQANLRPIMPSWTGNDSALLWYRGNYNTAQSSDAAIVGIVEHRSEVVGQMHYMDATTNNTFLTNGAPLVFDPAVNRWHVQTVGNGGTIISSADAIAETPTNLMTQVTLTNAGTYDLWVNFWGMPTADWRIQAGLTLETMQTFRSARCQQVRDWTHDTSLVIANVSNNYLYQAYVGRVVVTNNSAVNVFIGGNALQTGGTGSTFVGNTCRTWYDGISYAKVEPFHIQRVYHSGPSNMTLVWNSSPPELSLASLTYTLWKATSLAPSAVWTAVATNIQSGGYTTTNIDNYASGNAAFYRVTQP